MCRVAAVIVLSSAALAGCQSFKQPHVDVAEPTQALPPLQAQPAVINGSIFQSAQYRPLFEDHRARLIGDTITVQIVEKVSASQKSTSTIDKSGKVDASLSAVPLLKPSALTRSSAEGNSANSF